MKKICPSVFVFIFLTMLLTGSMTACNNQEKKITEEKITVLSQATATIGKEGGTVSLPDGIKVLVEAGTLQSENPITISLVGAGKYFGNDAANHIVIQCTATQKEFSKPVTIQIPVPKEWQGKTSLEAAGAEIDEASGIIKTIPSDLKDMDGVKTLVMQTSHFSTYTGSFWETPPTSAGPLEIPFYRQGSASTCWAASIQMLCEGVKHKEFHEVWDIMKKLGYTDGVSPAQFKFFSSAISHLRIYTDATAITEYWQYNSPEGMTKAIKHHIALGHPVLLLTNYPIMTTAGAHAVVITGYDAGHFVLHDPASLAAAVGYQSVAIADLVKIAFTSTNAAIITAIPAAVSPPSLISLSPEENTVRFTGPRKPGSVQEENYSLKYNATSAKGYSFISGTQVLVDTIPATVTKLVIKNLPISNGSRTNAKRGSVNIFISGAPDPKNNKNYAESNLPLAPNSIYNFSKEIELSDFHKPSEEYIKYTIKVSVRTDGSGDDDEFFIDAVMAPPDPLNGEWNIHTEVTAVTNFYAKEGTKDDVLNRITVLNNNSALYQYYKEESSEWNEGVVQNLQRKPGDMVNFVILKEMKQGVAWGKITITGKMTGPDSWTATQVIEGVDNNGKPTYVSIAMSATRRKN
jgi:hypothetical protein